MSVINYCIPGLGADERVFQNLRIPNCIVLNWLEPAKKEPLLSYCERLLTQIDTSQPFNLIGVSFGGLVACQLEELLYSKPERTILISSLTSNKELSFQLKLIGSLRLHIPALNILAKPPKFIAHYMFSVRNGVDKHILDGIINDTNVNIIRWSVNLLLTTKYDFTPTNLERIHGDADRLLLCPSNCSHVVKDGGHFMVITHARELRKVLNL